MSTTVIEVDSSLMTEASGDGSDRRRNQYRENLENGSILVFSSTPFSLPDQDRRVLLEVQQSRRAHHKNISYRPMEDRVRGFASGSADAERLRQAMRTYSRQVTHFVAALLPEYARQWRLDFASFRPVEEDGRPLRTLARNDLLHVDAFPTRPIWGDRILRVFTNINPAQSRVWITSDTFDVLAEQYALAAGLPAIAREARSPLRPVRRTAARLLRALGAPLPDRSAYDEFMLRFHDYLKLNAAFQQNCAKRRWDFPPGATWMVFTDMVSHAVLSGQFALEQTFIVSRSSLLCPDKAPVRILENLCGTPLLA